MCNKHAEHSSHTAGAHCCTPGSCGCAKPRRAGGVDFAAVALAMSALTLGGLLVSQLNRGGSIDPSSSAIAEMVNQGIAGETAMITFDSGSNEDTLLVLDQRREQVMLYGMRSQRNLEYRHRESLRELFTAARGAVKRMDPAAQPGGSPGAPVNPSR